MREITSHQGFQIEDIPFASSLLHPELYKLSDKQKPHCCTYHIDRVLAEHGHPILHLQPYHLDLNPVELMWATIKDWIAKNNI
jgi:transposase